VWRSNQQHREEDALRGQAFILKKWSSSKKSEGANPPSLHLGIIM
jgi:hypothetical protein